MSDREVIQRTYESALLAGVYAAFTAAYTEELGKKQKEVEAEARFREGVAHARFLRDRALALLPQGKAAPCLRTSRRGSK